MKKRLRTSRKKRLFLSCLLVLFLMTAACSSKEAVLLDTEDLVYEDEKEAPDMKEQEEQVEKSSLFVHICGEVCEPGVYELPDGSRIYEAVEAAGGFTENALEDYVNLALVLEDGWKIEIPSEEDGIPENQKQAAETDMYDFGGIAAGNREAGDGLVDINTAAKQELCTLPGVGESRAESIIAYREQNGGFSRIEDIMKVDGIKEGMFEKMKDNICVRGVK